MGAYSKLHNKTYQEIKKNFPYFVIRENIKPDWLVSSRGTKLELDLYIEQINTAIEIQGAQHYVFTPMFHKSQADFKAQLRRDQEKRDLCYGHGVRLVEIAMILDLELFIKELLQDKKPEIMQLPLNEQRALAKEIARKQKVKKPRPSIMRTKKWKIWLKNKKLREKGLLPPAMKYRKLPGSHRQRNRARKILQCKWISDDNLLVWGGREEHTVIYHGINEYVCDCTHFVQHKTICSHVIKVMMNEGVFPLPTLEPQEQSR
jgi:hypothetical protein